MKAIGRRGGRRPKLKRTGNESLRQALRDRIGVDKLVTMIGLALESESATERASAARLIVAELSEGGTKENTLPYLVDSLLAMRPRERERPWTRDA